MKKSFIYRKAFSLVEISVVIIIIGILIAGVTQGTRLIDESRLKTARDLTTNSRVASMEQLVLWYEPSLVASFSKTDAVDGAVISQWNDINPQSGILKFHAKAGQRTDNTKITYNVAPGGTSANTSGPVYVEDGINHIPTLRFSNNNSSAYRYLAVDASMKNMPQDSMTFSIVISFRSLGNTISFLDRTCTNSSGAASICTSSTSLGNPLFLIFLSSNGMLSACARSDSNSNFGASSPCFDTNQILSAGRNYIITYQRDYGNTFSVYVNGSLAISKADSGESITLDPFKIGRIADADANNIADMDISEFIFFSGAIKKKDRVAVEQYLGKKYNIGLSG